MNEQVPLAPYTTFRLGGVAHAFFIAQSITNITEALSYAKKHALPVFPLGGGSNVLISEKGFYGVVIKIELLGVEREEHTDAVVYVISAGESWDACVARACREGLWGVENLSGIPGTVGAAPIQNIGAYGSELGDTLLWVEAIETATGNLIRLSAEECTLTYRGSIFKKYPNRYIIVRVALSLRTHGTPNIGYRDLNDSLAHIHPLSPEVIRACVLAIRSRKFPDLSKEGTAGSFFLNPIVSPEHATQLLQRYPDLPHFAVSGGVKLSLAWLLDHALHLKGARVGGARLYEKQPLVIVTDHTARVSDVYALKEKIFSQVHDAFDISIDAEVRII